LWTAGGAEDEPVDPPLHPDNVVRAIPASTNQQDLMLKTPIIGSGFHS
jgi:hypothetical protein